jgi:hypothetical protein
VSDQTGTVPVEVPANADTTIEATADAVQQASQAAADAEPTAAAAEAVTPATEAAPAVEAPAAEAPAVEPASSTQAEATATATETTSGGGAQATPPPAESAATADSTVGDATAGVQDAAAAATGDAAAPGPGSPEATDAVGSVQDAVASTTQGVVDNVVSGTPGSESLVATSTTDAVSEQLAAVGGGGGGLPPADALTGGLDRLPDVLSGSADALTAVGGPVPDVLSGTLYPAVDILSGPADTLIGGGPVPDVLSGTLAPVAPGVEEGVLAAEPLPGSVSSLPHALLGPTDGLTATAAPGPDVLPGALGSVGAGLEEGTLPPGLAPDAGAGTVDTLAGADPGGGLAELAPVSEGDGALEGFPFEALPALTPGSEGAMFLSAGLATLAGLSLVARASGAPVGSLLTTRFLLAGVPPIPVRCMVAAAVNRPATLAAGAAGAVADGAVRGIRTSGERFAGAAAGTLAAVGGELRDGFVYGADRGLGRFGDESEGDTPLWMLAMLLGIVYFAFISAWIWVAKRRRWHLLT